MYDQYIVCEENFRARDDGRPGRLGSGQGAAQRCQVGVVGQRLPDLHRVDAQREPGGDTGEPVGGRAGQG